MALQQTKSTWYSFVKERQREKKTPILNRCIIKKDLCTVNPALSVAR